MSEQYPLPRSIREDDFLSSADQTEFGPPTWLLFDAEDVLVYVKPAGGSVFGQVIGGWSVVPTDTLPGTFQIVFETGRAAGDVVRVKGARSHERLTNVTQAGAIRAVPLERELDRIGVVMQELRRDNDRSVNLLTDAQNAAAVAEAARDAALDAQDGSEVAETGSEDARDAAFAWASEGEDTPVDDGVNPPGFSAFHHAEKSAASAAAAAQSAAGVNLPAIEGGDAGKLLFAKQDETGYELNDILGQAEETNPPGDTVVLIQKTDGSYGKTPVAVLGGGTVVTAPAISGRQDDYSPSGYGSGTGEIRVALSGSGGSLGQNGMITGLTGGISGREVRLTNTHATHALILADENDRSWDRDNLIADNSTAANRFALTALEDRTMGSVLVLPGASALLRYDGALSRWRLADITPPPVGEATDNLLVNSDFGINNGGGSYNNPNGGETLDRWFAQLRSAEGLGGTVSQGTLVPSHRALIFGRPRAFVRIAMSGTNPASVPVFQQHIPNAALLSGGPVHVSYWTRIVSDPLAEGLNVSVLLQQRFGTGGSPSTTVSTLLADRGITPGLWRQYICFGYLPSIAGATFGSNGDDTLTLQFGFRRRAQTVDMTAIKVAYGWWPSLWRRPDPALEALRV